ncbi:hypothetical protein [Actinophytocola sediminis]
MKVYTESSISGLAVLLRRVGTSVGFLFGFGLLALVMAGNASADDQRPDRERPVPGVVDSVAEVLSPVTDAVEPVLERLSPVVHAGSEALAPVVKPVAGMVEPMVKPIVEPILQPVVSTVTPVLDTVAPVTEPVVGPLLNAADPVVEPISEATGTTDVVSEITDTGSESTVSPERAQPRPEPAPIRAVTVSPKVVPEVIRWSDAPEASHGDGGHASAADLTWHLGPANPVDTPGVPVVPINAAPGGSGSVGGSGGSHGGDVVVSSPGSSLADDDGSGRSPPDTIAGHPWFGYDRPACPS